MGLNQGKRAPPDRKASQNGFMSGALTTMIATNAFGLGIDKRDLRFVLHYHFPGSAEAYYQEAGRAGRDGKPAVCAILYRVEDSRVQSYFLGGENTAVEAAVKAALPLGPNPPGERSGTQPLWQPLGRRRRDARV